MKPFGETGMISACSLLLLGALFQPVFGQQESLRERLHEAIVVASGNQLDIVNVKPTPLGAIYEVELNSGELLYADAAGEYLFAGDMYQTTPDGLLNLSIATRRETIARKVSAVPDEEAIIFEPDGEVRATLNIFTDVDCGFCRQLHGERGQYLDLGLRIRYLAYPRGGENATSYDKMISVWCSQDRRRALTQAKNGQNLPIRDCETPVMAHFDLGNQLGIQGTPALVFPDGRVIPGYVEAPRLVELLESE